MSKHNIVEKVMLAAPVIPVVTIDDICEGVKLAKALVAGGLPSIEVTLRTAAAMEALRVISSEVEGAIPGAGTVLTSAQVEETQKAGAKFMVSPGGSPGLLDAAEEADIPLLPGVATATEAMALGERGYQYLKFFPASLAGGEKYLKAIGAPLPQFKFCPTGGINLNNAAHYLALDNVLCVGGSWVAPKDLVEAGKWDQITELAKAASRLGS